VDPLYHLALAGEWAAAVERGGPYDRSTLGASLDEVGFIHCSFAAQVAPTRRRFYADRDDVVLLRIDPDRLVDEVKVEDLHDTGEAFPHLYGPLPLDAVVEVEPLPQRAT
jgi:glutathione S-transferase